MRIEKRQTFLESKKMNINSEYIGFKENDHGDWDDEHSECYTKSNRE